MKSSLQLFFLTLLGFSLCAKEIYVAPGGSDKNPGTAKAPLATIKAAASKAGPGDVVKIAPGIYREQIEFRKSGKKGAPITFLGSRGKKGEYLTIIEAPGTVLEQWQKAPEIAPGVWKVKLPVRPDVIMMNGKMIAFINTRCMSYPRWKKLPSEITQKMIHGPEKEGRISGFDLMSLPPEIRVSHILFRKRKEQLWPVINYVLSGWSRGMLYVRFANADKPQNHRFTASKGAGFLLNNASHLYFKDLHLRGSRLQFRLSGKSSHNTIDSCLLMHGGIRVRFDDKAAYNTVKNSILTSGFTQNKHFKARSPEDMRGGVLYLLFKHIIGPSSSDDVGVRDMGRHNKILDNVIVHGLIGLFAWGADCEVRGNVIRGMSSVGILTGPGTVGKFSENLIMNCAIALRIHELRSARTKREEYHFRNLFVQDPRAGGQVFVHCESHRWGPDKINFEKGTAKYKKNPVDPVDAGKMYIYHNTFWGGREDAPHFSVQYLAQRFRMVMPFFFVNNVVRYSPLMETRSQELFNGNLLYTSPILQGRKVRRRDPEVPKRNRLIDVEKSKKIWNNRVIPGLPDLTLSTGSPALECGIDISRPFSANGKKFSAFPGFKPGYFKGKAPAAGALQKEESLTKFLNMHKKAEAVIRQLEALNAKP